MKLTDFTHNLRVGDYDCVIVQHLSLKDALDVHNAVEKYLAVNKRAHRRSWYYEEPFRFADKSGVEALDGRFPRTYHRYEMPYEFTEWEEEPEPQTSSARSGSPPRKHIGIGILDPPGPPKRPPGAIPAIPWSSVLRGFALLILVGLTLGIVVLLCAQL